MKRLTQQIIEEVIKAPHWLSDGNTLTIKLTDLRNIIDSKCAMIKPINMDDVDLNYYHQFEPFPLVLNTYKTKENQWIATLESTPGMIVFSESEEDAVEELMISIKVKLLYDLKNRRDVKT